MDSILNSSASGNVVEAGALHSFERQLAAQWPVANWQNLHVVLAVSGGADSMALLRAILAVKAACGGVGAVHVGHFDHGLRRGASHADADWLRESCRRLEVPLEVGRSDVMLRAIEDGDGIEAAARNVRYEFLRRMAERLGARFVVTAHTANDQAETVLHRIIRGTGLAGLKGIPASRPLSKSVTLTRPMLAVNRAKVTEYLAEVGQEFRDDSSNANPQHTRNRLRNEILPTIRERLNPEVDAALIRLAEQAAEAQAIVEDLASRIATECVRLELDSLAATRDAARAAIRRIHIDCGMLAIHPMLLIREVCRVAWRESNWPQQAMGASEWHKLAWLVVKRGSDRFHLPAGVFAEREGSSVVLIRGDSRCLP